MDSIPRCFSLGSIAVLLQRSSGNCLLQIQRNILDDDDDDADEAVVGFGEHERPRSFTSPVHGSLYILSDTCNIGIASRAQLVVLQHVIFHEGAAPDSYEWPSSTGLWLDAVASRFKFLPFPARRWLEAEAAQVLAAICTV